MANNDLVVLNSILDRRKAQSYAKMPDDQFFELFTFDQILKNYDLSDDELSAGQTGAGNDGGIDGFFVFINEEIVLEAEEKTFAQIKKNPRIDIVLVQAKREASFSEKALDRALTSLKDLFDLTKETKDLQKFYNESVCEWRERFKIAYLSLSSKHPLLAIRFMYATKGSTDEIHPNVANRSGLLNKVLKELFSNAEVNVGFWGARELLDAARREKNYTLTLKIAENAITRGKDDYIVLSSLSDYLEFVTDEAGALRKYIFESNVRDFQGENEVNRDIALTLQKNDGVDFWWLNNGITILASKASIVGKAITLDDVQIVNGLQTTTTIFNHLGKGTQDLRSILVRIIVTLEPKTSDRIIKATNYQTLISPASLRATDDIQRDIEDYFLQHGLFYDRRKNYYKNQGKPRDEIISIPYLAQAVASIVLRRPHEARFQPSSLLKKDENYKQVFDRSFDMVVYALCATYMKLVDLVISMEEDSEIRQDAKELRFHMGMWLVIQTTKKSGYTHRDVVKIGKVTPEVAAGVIRDLVKIAREFASTRKMTINQLSKSGEFVTHLLSRS